MGLAASSRRGLAVTTLSSTALRLSTSENIANTHPSTIDDDEHNDIDVDDDEDVSQVMEEMLAMDDTAVDVVEESLLDNAISNSITQMIINDRKLAAEGGLKTPLEKFEEIYAVSFISLPICALPLSLTCFFGVGICRELKVRNTTKMNHNRIC